MSKYTLCKFREQDTRTYTYLTGDVIYSVGDEVMVPGKGDTEKRVIVAGFTDDEPAFECKHIIGMAPLREDKPASDVEKLVTSGVVETVGDILGRGIGDNSKAMTPLETHTTNVDDIYAEAKNWLDGSKIENQAQADDVTRLKDMASKASKAADAQRKVEAKPFDDGKAAVQKAWKPLIDRADKVETAAKGALGDWLRRENTRLQAEAETARKAAQELAAKALAESRAAATSGDLNALEEAEALLKGAKSANRDATRMESTKPAAKVEGMARAMTLHTVWDCEIADAVEGEASAKTLLARWAFVRDPQRCLDLFLQMAREDVRSGVRSIPGTTISSRQVI